MSDSTQSRSVSDFQRNLKSHLRRLKKMGKPEVLTVNGHAEVVVQSTAGYQKLLEQADHADAMKILRERIRAADSGEPGIPAEKLLDDIRQRLRGSTGSRSFSSNSRRRRRGVVCKSIRN